MDEVAVAAEFGNHAEAVMAKELLAAHGIASIVHSDDCGGMAGGQTFIRGVQVLVAVTDLKRSNEILHSG
jgi:hypothetical protein